MTYPYRARQKGWQGKVLVAFRLKTDGGVSDIRVAQSSGCQFLDESAVATIQKAAPFPSIGHEARLQLPVTYRLR